MPQKPHTLEHTVLLNDGNVFHYTCNPPGYDVLKKYNIQPIGDSLGCGDPSEVLLIPSSLYKKRGHKIGEDLKIVSEILLRKLDRES